MFWEEITTIEDRWKFQLAQAVAHGERLTSSGEKQETKNFTRQLHRRAFPALYRRRRQAAQED